MTFVITNCLSIENSQGDMNTILLFCIFVGIVISQDSHTTQYDRFQSCKVDKLFIQTTYGGLLADPCKDMTTGPGEKFRKILLKNGIPCDASWCINETNYGCTEKVARDGCPNAEHIIDLKQSGDEYKNCNKNILGNLVMAYSKWNNEVGTSSGFKSNWEAIKREKESVYKEIFEMADFFVKNCSGNFISYTPKYINSSIDENPCGGNIVSDSDVDTDSDGVEDEKYCVTIDMVVIILLVCILYTMFIIVTVNKITKNITSRVEPPPGDDENPAHVEMDNITYSEIEL